MCTVQSVQLVEVTKLRLELVQSLSPGKLNLVLFDSCKDQTFGYYTIILGGRQVLTMLNPKLKQIFFSQHYNLSISLWIFCGFWAKNHNKQYVVFYVEDGAD